MAFPLIGAALPHLPNRRVRTRTHGGVTGKASDPLPMSILHLIWLHAGLCGKPLACRRLAFKPAPMRTLFSLTCVIVAPALAFRKSGRGRLKSAPRKSAIGLLTPGSHIQGQSPCLVGAAFLLPHFPLQFH